MKDFIVQFVRGILICCGALVGLSVVGALVTPPDVLRGAHAVFSELVLLWIALWAVAWLVGQIPSSGEA